jgi:hypothetical protein
MKNVRNYLNYFQVTYARDCAMAHAVSRLLLTAEARVRAQIGPRGICGGQSDTGTCFSASPPPQILFHRGFPYSHVTRGMEEARWS